MKAESEILPYVSNKQKKKKCFEKKITLVHDAMMWIANEQDVKAILKLWTPYGATEE